MEITLGILALCGTMVGVLVWVIRSQRGTIKDQQKTINNHLHNLQSSIDRLPCRNRPACPVEVKT